MKEKHLYTKELFPKACDTQEYGEMKGHEKMKEQPPVAQYRFLFLRNEHVQPHTP
jgi:hypothetical protein